MAKKICDLEGCDVDVSAFSYKACDKEYCSTEHAQAAAKAAPEPLPSVEEIAKAGYTNPEKILETLKEERATIGTPCKGCGTTEVPIVDGYCSFACEEKHKAESAPDDVSTHEDVTASEIGRVAAEDEAAEKKAKKKKKKKTRSSSS